MRGKQQYVMTRHGRMTPNPNKPGGVTNPTDHNLAPKHCVTVIGAFRLLTNQYSKPPKRKVKHEKQCLGNYE